MAREQQDQLQRTLVDVRCFWQWVSVSSSIIMKLLVVSGIDSGLTILGQSLSLLELHGVH